MFTTSFPKHTPTIHYHNIGLLEGPTETYSWMIDTILFP
jgi:hypothetical protein